MSTKNPVTIEDLGDGTYEASNGVIVCPPVPTGTSPAAWAAAELTRLRVEAAFAAQHMKALEALLLDELRGSRTEQFGGYRVTVKSRRNDSQDVKRFAQLLDETPLEPRVLLDTIAAAVRFRQSVPEEVLPLLRDVTTIGESREWLVVEQIEIRE